MIKEGLKTALNQIRELSTPLYQQEVPIITDTTDIASFGNPILNNLQVQNEFIPSLINRIVYTSFELKNMTNPLAVLEGDTIPIGWAGQEIYTNPDKGREYNPDDFAGLLVKYESDIKVQYTHVNKKIQFVKTINREILKRAFTSWENLDSFIQSIVQSMYNSLYMQNYNWTKELMAKCYVGNKVQMIKIDEPNTEEMAKKFVTLARSLFLNFQIPSHKYNAWSKMTGDSKPIITQTSPEDVLFIIRNDLRAYLDVNLLANAFNIDRTKLLGNIISIEDFSIFEGGNKIINADNLVGFICDKAFFKLKVQDESFETFYNPNNQTWQYYLNQSKMVNFSLFANSVALVSELPAVKLNDLKVNKTNVSLGFNEIELIAEPTNFSDELTLTVDSANADKVKINILNNFKFEMEVLAGVTNNITVTATAGTYTTNFTFTVDGVTQKTTRSLSK